MLHLIPVPMATWLLQGAAARDTIVTIQVPAPRAWTDVVVAGGQFVVSLAVLGMLVAIVLAVVALRKSVQELTKLVQSSYGDISAAAHSVRGVADDVRGITTTLKGDVAAVGETVRSVNDGVRAAVARAEDRLERLDALVEVAQEEAESFVVSSAATLRGLRFGASALRRSFLFARKNGLRRVRKRPRSRLDADRHDRPDDRRDDRRDDPRAERRDAGRSERPRIRDVAPEEV